MPIFTKITKKSVPEPWKTLNSRYVLNDEWISVRADTCEMPDGTQVHPYYVIEFPHWANVVALTPAREIVLIRQYRHAYGKVILELPGGTLDEGEPPAKGVQRELLEETGFTASEFIETARVSANPTNHSNLSVSFLALNARKVSEQQLDASEDIEVVVTPLEEVKQLMKRNQLPQAMHVTSLFYALQYLEQKGL